MLSIRLPVINEDDDGCVVFRVSAKIEVRGPFPRLLSVGVGAKYGPASVENGMLGP